MKRLRRFVLLFLVSGLIITVSHTILASLPVSAREAEGVGSRPPLVSQVSQPITNQNSLESQDFTDLTVTYSPPAVNFPAFFKATAVTTSNKDIIYAWYFGDNTKPQISEEATITHTYSMTGAYTMVVTAVEAPNFDNFITRSVSVVVGEPARRFLPLVFKNFTAPNPPPDLSCSLTIAPANPASGQPILVVVQLANEGQGTADGFWVDLYVNPTTLPAPGRNNRLRWQDACGGPATCSRGIAWSISNAPLSGGQTRTLISIPKDFNPPAGQGFESDNSRWESGFLPGGAYTIYAYVDSINNDSTPNIDGAVQEVNEQNNLCASSLFVPAAASLESDSGPGPLPRRLPSP